MTHLPTLNLIIMCFIYRIFLIILVSCFSSCQNGTNNNLLDLFTEEYFLSSPLDFSIEEDSLARIEGITCNNNDLIVYDVYDAHCFTLFDAISGKFITRFGTIGQGPDEILIGSYGELTNGNYYVFNDQLKRIWIFNTDSLRNNIKKPQTNIQYNIQESQFTKLLPVTDSIFVGVGDYKKGTQIVVFDINNEVLDYGIDTYNFNDASFNVYTRFLSNQGNFVKHPQYNKFVFSVNFSSNIDFFELKNNEIIPSKLLRLGNPLYEPIIEGGGTIFRAVPDEQAITGYIDLSAGNRYVYALYSEKRLYENWRKSKVVLVFDWEGNPIARLNIDREVYYIAVDEANNKLFAAVKNETKGWNIICYRLEL